MVLSNYRQRSREEWFEPKKEFVIPISEENNPEYRQCLLCLKWVSLLGSYDENGKMRHYDHMPAAMGLCTCWMLDYRKKWVVEANKSEKFEIDIFADE